MKRALGLVQGNSMQGKQNFKFLLRHFDKCDPNKSFLGRDSDKRNGNTFAVFCNKKLGCQC